MDEEPNEPSMAPDDILADTEPVEQEELSPEDKMQRDISLLTDKVRYYQDLCTSASDNSNPEGLSVNLVNLAWVNTRLGRQAAYAMYLARNADRGARRFRAERTLLLAKTQAVNKSELQAEIDSESYFNLASEVMLVAERANDLCYRTDTMMKMCQSRLSLIKGELK